MRFVYRSGADPKAIGTRLGRLLAVEFGKCLARKRKPTERFEVFGPFFFAQRVSVDIGRAAEQQLTSLIKVVAEDSLGFTPMA